MRILAIGAHPDDIEFGMCGTMIKLADEGHECFGLVLTKGEMGTRGTDEIRVEETKKAAESAGYKLEMLDLGDTKIQDNPKTREQVANIVRKCKPDVVFVPYHTSVFNHKDGMAHPDHTTTGKMVRHALRIAKFQKVQLEHPAHLVTSLVYYMVPRNKSPTLVNDVSKYVERMKEAMRCHESQINEEFLHRLLQFREFYGFWFGMKYAEAFIVEDPMKFDVNLLK